MSTVVFSCNALEYNSSRLSSLQAGEEERNENTDRPHTTQGQRPKEPTMPQTRGLQGAKGVTYKQGGNKGVAGTGGPSGSGRARGTRRAELPPPPL